MNKLSTFAGDGALRIKDRLVLPLLTMAWSEHPEAQDSKILGMTECEEDTMSRDFSYFRNEAVFAASCSLKLGREKKAAIVQRVCEPLDCSA